MAEGRAAKERVGANACGCDDSIEMAPFIVLIGCTLLVLFSARGATVVRC
jgi:hypothetical protein